MNNTFYHPAHKLEYLIPFRRQLTSDEATRIVDRLITREKAALFEDFKSTPEGKAWTGDENKKKEELFFDAHRMKAPIFVFGESLEEFVNDGASDKKG